MKCLAVEYTESNGFVSLGRCESIENGKNLVESRVNEIKLLSPLDSFTICGSWSDHENNSKLLVWNGHEQIEYTVIKFTNQKRK